MACAATLGGCTRDRETRSTGSVQAASAAETTRPTPAAATVASPDGGAGRSANGEPSAVLHIASNTQQTIDDLRIAAGNFWPEKYTGESGREREGLTAMLFLFFRDDPSSDRKIRVHPGQAFTAGGYSFEVHAIDASTVTVTMHR